MLKREVHVRPMILPLVEGVRTTSVEVDLWEQAEEGRWRVRKEFVVTDGAWRSHAAELCEKYDATLVIEKDPEESIRRSTKWENSPNGLPGYSGLGIIKRKDESWVILDLPTEDGCRTFVDLQGPGASYVGWSPFAPKGRLKYSLNDHGLLVVEELPDPEAVKRSKEKWFKLGGSPPGKMALKETCQRCHGRGRVQVDKGDHEDCPDCKGTGSPK